MGGDLVWNLSHNATHRYLYTYTNYIVLPISSQLRKINRVGQSINVLEIKCILYRIFSQWTDHSKKYFSRGWWLNNLFNLSGTLLVRSWFCIPAAPVWRGSNSAYWILYIFYITKNCIEALTVLAKEDRTKCLYTTFGFVCISCGSYPWDYFRISSLASHPALSRSDYLYTSVY